MKKIVLLLALIIMTLVSCSQKNVWPRDRYTGPGGGLYTGPGGGLYKGSGSNPYMSNQPPREELLKYLNDNKMTNILKILEKAGF